MWWKPDFWKEHCGADSSCVSLHCGDSSDNSAVNAGGAAGFLQKMQAILC